MINNSSRFRSVNTIRNSSSFFNRSSSQRKRKDKIEESQNKKDDKKIVDNSDKYSDEFENLKKRLHMKRH